MKDCEKHLDRRERREEDIYRISTLVAGNFEIQEVLDRLAEAAVKVTNTTACSIRLLDDNVGKLQMRSTYGRAKPGDYLALINSFGVLEVAKAESSAAEGLGIERGAPITVADGLSA